MKCQISIIIPVYNTAKYISECVNSTFKQGVDSYEIIIIDDGSTDNSWDIIYDYKNTYSNIKAFKQDRKRQGAARNLGLTYANGEYVAFLDSDDVVPNGAYKHMYELARKYDSDLIVGVQESFNSTSQWIGVPVHNRRFHGCSVNVNIEKMPDLLTDISACNKLVRRELLVSNGIKFIEDAAGEDIDFMGKVYIHAKTITLTNKVVYKYRARDDALTLRLTVAFFMDRVNATLGLRDRYKSSSNLTPYNALLMSEVRKLTGKRLDKCISQLPYDQQLIILNDIRKLTLYLSDKEILNNYNLTADQKIRCLFVLHGKYDELMAYIHDPFSARVLLLLRDDNISARLMSEISFTYLSAISDITFPLSIKEFLFKYASHRAEVSIICNILKKIMRFIRRLTGTPLLALLKYLTLFPICNYIKRCNKNVDVWLIDERLCSSAEDNSAVFFRHVRKFHPEKNIYFVISKKSQHVDSLKSKSNVIYQNTWTHAYYLHMASVLLSTDNFKALAYPGVIYPNFYNKYYCVFMQHGVAGNKYLSYVKNRYRYFDLVIVSSDFEKQFFINDYGYTSSEVAVTGIARFDDLPLESSGKIQSILIAPTWRKWLKDLNTIIFSKYYHHWMGLLNDDAFVRLIAENNVNVYFMPHFNMSRHIMQYEAKSDYIKIIDNAGEVLSSYIKRCDLLITDYSSVMYDYIFQRKPVVCYEFDKHEWSNQSRHRPHVDLGNNFPADSAKDIEGVVAHVKKYILDGLSVNLEKDELRRKYIKHFDHNNCDRIYKAILNRTGDIY